jgi:hypothetical protein
MDQKRKRDDDMPNRSSNMEPAEGSRENVRNSGDDLGTSSDRAMFDERNSSSGGGITNRGRDREQAEQNQLPPRGRSQSER